MMHFDFEAAVMVHMHNTYAARAERTIDDEMTNADIAIGAARAWKVRAIHAEETNREKEAQIKTLMALLEKANQTIDMLLEDA
jgi:hypothetical protein